MLCRMEENNLIQPDTFTLIGNYFMDDEIIKEEKFTGF